MSLRNPFQKERSWRDGALIAVRKVGVIAYQIFRPPSIEPNYEQKGSYFFDVHGNVAWIGEGKITKCFFVARLGTNKVLQLLPIIHNLFYFFHTSTSLSLRPSSEQKRRRTQYPINPFANILFKDLFRSVPNETIF